MKTKTLNFGLVFSALAALTLARVQPARAQNGVWTTNIATISPRALGAAATVGGKVYMVGGGTYSCGVNAMLQAYDPATNVWVNLANMPTARYELGATELNGQLYAIAGNPGCGSAAQAIRAVEAYYPASNTWSNKTLLPAGSWGAGVATANGKIYVIGGFTNLVYCYDPAGNSWSVKTPLPAPYTFNFGATVVANGIIYVIGGSPHLSSVYAYNPVTDSWTVKASMPTGRDSCAGAAVNGIIYVAGGFNGTSNLATVEAYTPATDSWSAVTPLPYRVATASAAAVNDTLYVMGGFNDSNATVGSVAAFTPPVLTNIVVTPANPVIGAGTNQQFTATGTYSDGSAHVLINAVGTGNWTAVAGMPAAKNGPACAAVNGHLYAVSGAGFDTAVFDYNPAANSWSIKTQLPGNYAYAGAAGIGNKFYFMGGCQNADCNTPGNELLIYNTLTDAWTSGASMILPRSLAGVGVINGKIYVAGGRQSNSGAGELQVQAYDPASNSWAMVHSMPVARSQCGAAVISGKFYVVGGFDNNPAAPLGSLVVYDPTTDTWTTKTPMPTPRLSLGAAVVGGLLYAIDGTTAAGAGTNLVEVYNPVTDSWSTGVPTLTAHSLLQPVVIGGTIYVAGSGPGNTAITNVESYTPQSLLWSSTSLAVAPINTNGVATGLTIGVTTITAMYGNASGNTTLTVVTQPAIMSQPVSVTVGASGTTTFTAGASGGALTYQWQFNGTNIAGATGSTLSLTNITASQAGCYTVIVSNAAGTTTSSCAQLTVVGINLYAGLTIYGSVGANYRVEYVNNLGSTNWQTLTNLALPISPYLLIDTDSPNNTRRFYRAILLP